MEQIADLTPDLFDIDTLYNDIKLNKLTINDKNINKVIDDTSEPNEILSEKTKEIDTSKTKEKKKEENIITNCTECNSTNIVEMYGYYVCQECGIQYNNIIDSSQEWRYYGSSDNKSSDPSRCGVPTNDLLPNNSMGSIISLNTRESTQMRRLRQIHSWNSSGYMDTTFNRNSKDMESVALNNGISPCIIQEAKYMYKKLAFHKYKKKAKKEAIQAACIQCSCKINNVPRDSNEMAMMFNISKKDMRKGAKQFEEMWSIINEENDDTLYIDLIPCNSVNFLQKRTRELKLPNEIKDLCEEVCTYVEKEDYLIKHVPLSRTAGCIYFTCEFLKVSVNKNDITNICSKSEVTINKCYQKLLKFKEEIIQNTSLKNYL